MGRGEEGWRWPNACKQILEGEERGADRKRCDGLNEQQKRRQDRTRTGAKTKKQERKENLWLTVDIAAECVCYVFDVENARLFKKNKQNTLVCVVVIVCMYACMHVWMYLCVDAFNEWDATPAPDHPLLLVRRVNWLMWARVVTAGPIRWWLVVVESVPMCGPNAVWPLPVIPVLPD